MLVVLFQPKKYLDLKMYYKMLLATYTTYYQKFDWEFDEIILADVGFVVNIRFLLWITYLWNKEILKWGKRKVELSSEHGILLLKSSIESNQNILNFEHPNPETPTFQKRPYKYEYIIYSWTSIQQYFGRTHS